MRIVHFDRGRGADVLRHGSSGVRGVPLARSTELGRYAVTVLHVEPDGVVGRHPAPLDQLFTVVAGHGWVAGADGARVDVSVGQAVVLDAGEVHEAGSAEGMTVVVVEADDLSS